MDSLIISIKKLTKSCDCDLRGIECNAKRFKRNFKNWTSGNNNIDKFIQDTQLSEHTNYVRKALEWIPYDRFCNVRYTAEDRMYRANWIDGHIDKWENYNENWKRKDQNMFVILKNLDDSINVTLKSIKEITIHHKVYGITQNPETNSYMVVVIDICKKCNNICNAIHFQQNFENWTSGNGDIDEIIKDTQLSAHIDNKIPNVLEWIPYDRFIKTQYITRNKFGKEYRANWIDGYIDKWDNESQNWKRKNQNMFVILKNLNDSTNFTLKSIKEITKHHKAYGITRIPKSKSYIVVVKDICKKCNNTCNAIHQRNFENWTSCNKKIDKLIRNTQLSNCYTNNILEWISYDRFCDIRNTAENGVYRANWIDGCIDEWDNINQKWRRKDQNMVVILKSLKNSNNIALKFINEVKLGITKKPGKKNYMMVLTCKVKCNSMCNSKYFQQNFGNWTSGNNNIDEFIQDTQISDCYTSNILEWIPYDKFHNIKNIKSITKDGSTNMYEANWIDGCIDKWDYENQNWKRKEQNMFVILKSLDNMNVIRFINEVAVYKFYGITRDPESRNYMVVSTCKEKCSHVCNAIRFQQNFKNWTSGNNDIDKFIQDTQLSTHTVYEIRNALEWMPFDRFYDIKYIAKGGFSTVYKANWIDGHIDEWDNKNQNWKRKDQGITVVLKILNNSKNVTLKFMNEFSLHYKEGVNNGFIIEFYGITQDPKTNNYIMVLEYAKNGSLRNYLNINYNKLRWSDKIYHLLNITCGIQHIHNNELIHRDLHVGNILVDDDTIITDMGLCKPADYNASENTISNIYGVLPYIAPEILRGQTYTKAADIYSLGIIMYEIISGLPPYHDVDHNKNLAITICQGLRPRFKIKVPQLIVHLIKKCLDANSSDRPTANEIEEVLYKWYYMPSDNQTVNLQLEIKNAEVINNNLSDSNIPSTNLGLYEIHPEAIYTSRLLKFYDDTIGVESLGID
ncbi:Ypk2p [Rhizophagus irregularis DAOM 197198w]|uniref:Ypk2p n=1 Tax=Rhizophagus irregularis (strain DAOM 197198w) TaxID=1432141 RepID=A0A015IC51_RHIIW|nr:Ypk2p [Rhizophagus irregularis DAOM 197198w]